jgi:hypothetical protein
MALGVTQPTANASANGGTGREAAMNNRAATVERSSALAKMGGGIKRSNKRSAKRLGKRSNKRSAKRRGKRSNKRSAKRRGKRSNKRSGKRSAKRRCKRSAKRIKKYVGGFTAPVVGGPTAIVV